MAKVRDRASFEWAVAAASVALDVDAAGRERRARVAAGGAATTPWRLPQVEVALQGRVLDVDVCASAAALAADGAVLQSDNAYKAKLLPRVVGRAIAETAGLR